MAEPRLVNLTERIVAQMLDDIIQSERACNCMKCRLDAMAYALNRLKPKYVVSVQGSAFTEFELSKVQNRVDIYKTVLEAVQRIKDMPQH